MVNEPSGADSLHWPATPLAVCRMSPGTLLYHAPGFPIPSRSAGDADGIAPAGSVSGLVLEGQDPELSLQARNGPTTTNEKSYPAERRSEK